MTTFGRRTFAAPRRAPKPATLGFLGGAPYAAGVLLLVMLSTALFYREITTDQAWLGKSPWDLTPGAAYDIGPFVSPKGCEPARRTSGDYIPRACVTGYVFAEPERYGLADTPAKRRPPRRYYWIDSGPDALLVACPMWAACKVERVVEQRFAGREALPIRTPAAKAAARRAPFSYILALFVEIGAKALLVAFIAALMAVRIARSLNPAAQ